MKWFKHMANAGDDDFIEWLEEEYGFEGYGRWWRIIETIAKSMDKNRDDPSAEHTWKKWQTKLRGKRSQLLGYLLAMQLRGKIEVEYNEEVLKITCSKVLEMRDEYSRKSGHTPIATPDNVAPDTEKEKEKERKNPLSPKGEAEADMFPVPKIELETIAKIWNSILTGFCTGVKNPSQWTDTRKNNIQRRLKDTFENNPQKFTEYCQRIRESGFCIGENNSGWRADFDWALKPTSISKVMEGAYIRKAVASPTRNQNQREGSRTI